MKKLALFSLLAFLVEGCSDSKEESSPSIREKLDSATRVKSERNVNPYASVDVSPMDMAYFPVDYPKLKMSGATTESPVARVIYSRPHLQGRTLFVDVQKYGEPWRLGANESTEIEFYRDVTIMGQRIRSGRYIIYCMPAEQSWTIVFNSNIDTWGLEHDRAKDIAKFTIPVKNTGSRIEYYTMVFEKMDGGANLLMAWDRFEARLPINF